MISKKQLAIAVGAGVGAAVLWHRRPLPDIRGEVVLITGGSTGLGFALAREFGRLGCRVAICARSADRLAEAERKLGSAGFSVFAATCDVSDGAQVTSLVEDVRSHFGAVDILVNNAGEILVAPLQNTTAADFERALSVMFWGTVNTTLAVLPEMRKRGSGRIATVSSIGGKVSVPHLVAYSCAKSAALAFSEGLRAELADTGISVTTIAPGLMRTGSHVNARFKGDQSSEAAWFSVAASAPLLAMNAERAATQTVRAIRRGSAEKVLSLPASLLARVQGMLPGLVPNLMGVANSLLPPASSQQLAATEGRHFTKRHGPLMKALTALGSAAGRRLNQVS